MDEHPGSPHDNSGRVRGDDRDARESAYALAEDAFAPGHAKPMTQVNGTNELMIQILDA
jgi:hypothetical protein